MANTVDYLPIANGSGANVEAQADYLADVSSGGALQNGFQAGIAQSAKVNKVIRQSSMIAAAVATFISNSLNISVPDDGNLANLVAWMGESVRVAGQSYALDTGVANAYVIALLPPVTSYFQGLVVSFKAANSNTGACTLNAGGGAIPLVTNTNAALAQGDILAGGVYTAIYDLANNKFMITMMVKSQIVIPITFGTGTRMLFGNDAAPTGWTKVTDSDYDDCALRLVVGNLAGAGVNAFSSTFAKTATDGHAVTIAETPTHNHGASVSDPGHAHGVYDPGHIHTVPMLSSLQGGSTNSTVNWATSNTQMYTGRSTTGIGIYAATTGIGISIGYVGSGAAHSHGMDMRVKYRDVIFADKD